MRYPLLPVLGVLLSGPVMADPLRDTALEFFAPLPKVAPEDAGPSVTPDQIALGKALYQDTRLSSSGAMSCNTCHNLAEGGDDGLETWVGPDGSPGTRNTPTILNAVLNPAQFLDGREEDLAAQADGPRLASLARMNAPEAVLAFLTADAGYAAEFAAAFPAEGVSLAALDRALYAYQTTLLTPAPIDAWLAGDDAALDDDQKAGLELFLDKGCAYCHYGPNLGGDGYYPLGLVEKPGAEVLSADEAERFAVAEGDAEDFVFRTSPLRNVALTAPYFHSGKVSDLATAVTIMAAGQLGSELTPDEAALIATFLSSLSGTLPAEALP
jgi:cytochrome c peroxidase